MSKRGQMSYTICAELAQVFSELHLNFHVRLNKPEAQGEAAFYCSEETSLNITSNVEK